MKLIQQFKRNFNIWAVLSFVFIVIILLPNLNIIINLFSQPNENWYHIQEFLLKDYIINTFILIIFTGFFAILIGTSLAWLVTIYDFPLKKFFRWGLILPLAIPPYIAAYTYNGILNYTGVLQTFLRNTYDIKVNQKYFNIMSIQGAIFIFTIFLFPYVYTITKSFLTKQSASLIENARILGRSPLEIFIYVVLPISRAAIIGGASLVILEVLNDYGVVSYFGVPTFSTAIFRTWFGMGDIDSAIKLAAMLMFIVLLLLLIEKLFRGRRKYSFTTSKIRPITPIKLKGLKAFFAFAYSGIVFSLGFVIPTLQLISWTLLTYETILTKKFFVLIYNSVLVATISAVLIIVIAIVIANFNRINDGAISKFYAKVTTLGYSIPGAVIAVGVIVLFIFLDNHLFWLYKIFDSESSKLVLSTSLVMLIFAYMIRFLAIGYNTVESGYEKIGKKFFEASRTLGSNITQTFIKIDFPMIKPAIISGFIMVFVDILKELPLTLILRPFNFDTLATKAYQYANDEMIHEAAVASIIIIIISAISIYVFNKALEQEES